ncbi:hypothetical protein [Halosimplex marinum]|uniref:hypothetical protein n=1 Tax=Halosimplex marinum TaxID=3396620 RepID=UPI003F5616D5
MGRQREYLVALVTGWCLCWLVALSVLGRLTLELYFVVSFAGVLVAYELTAPIAVGLRQRRYVRAAIAVGALVFAVIVARRVLEAIPV